MNFYIYKIENLINSKVYIGITTNPKTRKRTHFCKLRNQKHCNIKLQNAWNKYGEDNFNFEVILTIDCDKTTAYECEEAYIAKYNSYEKGYNCNKGGLEHNGTAGDFTEYEVYMILATYNKFPRSGNIISKILNKPSKTINNIINGTNYRPYYEDFLLFSDDEKEEYHQLFNILYNCDEIILTWKKSSNNKLSSEQVYMILYQEEFGFPKTKKELMRNFNLCNYSIMLQIREGRTYKAEVYEYKNMSLEQKEQIKYHYTEMYNSKPLELLENPKA